MKKAYLILQDGTTFEGFGFGAEKGAIGQLVFTTGMVGYVETLTDPNFTGQIVLQTFPLVGNYGVMEEDFQGPCRVSGYVVREVCENPSNFRSQYDLNTYLKEQGIPGICGVDTRELTRILRDKGSMNACISDTKDANVEAIKAYTVQNAVEAVTVKEPVTHGEGTPVAVLDLGVKKSLIESLTKRGCQVTVLPASTTGDTILASGAKGVVLSDGPGNPADYAAIAAEIAKVLSKLPVFAIGLGHQLLAMANGGQTAALPYGHRGASQPAKEIAQNARTFITTQNHGYAVLSDTVKDGKPSFYNINDNTCEGLDYPGLKAFSVQFQPDDSNGPRNTGFLFDRFVDMMGGNN